MKKILIVVLLSTVTLSIHAQKIKIKKEEILVDKIKIGTIEKIKIKNDTLIDLYHEIKDNTGNPVFRFRGGFIESLLFQGKKKYFFHTIEFLETKKRAAIQDGKYYPTKKQMANYLVNYNLLNKDGVNTTSVSEYILNKDELPEEIQQTIKKEKELKAYASFKADRPLSDPIFVFFNKTTSGVSAISDNLVTKSRYHIYQGIKDPKTNEFVSKTFIGYAIAEDIISGEKTGWSTNPPKNYRPNPRGSYKLLVYNTKNVPIASYFSNTYKTYYPYEEFGITKNKLSTIESIKERMEYIAYDLMIKNML